MPGSLGLVLCVARKARAGLGRIAAAGDLGSGLPLGAATGPQSYGAQASATDPESDVLAVSGCVSRSRDAAAVADNIGDGEVRWKSESVGVGRHAGIGRKPSSRNVILGTSPPPSRHPCDQIQRALAGSDHMDGVT